MNQFIKTLRFGGGPWKCIVCGKSIRKFFPFSSDLQRVARENGFTHDFNRMETLNMEQCNCPFCLSSDRERLYLIYLEQHLRQNKSKSELLDFAPNPVFSARVKKLPGVHYFSADLFREDVDITIDICNMEQIGSGRFDIIICSHVLEHVPDPDKAMQELRRVMAPGGRAIIMVPLFLDVATTLENPAHDTDALRAQYYGQTDHVRLFAKPDFVNRLQAAGFRVNEVTPEALDQELVKKNAIAENSILYICTLQRQTTI